MVPTSGNLHSFLAKWFSAVPLKSHMLSPRVVSSPLCSYRASSSAGLESWLMELKRRELALSSHFQIWQDHWCLCNVFIQIISLCLFKKRHSFEITVRETRSFTNNHCILFGDRCRAKRLEEASVALLAQLRNSRVGEIRPNAETSVLLLLGSSLSRLALKLPPPKKCSAPASEPT